MICPLVMRSGVFPSRGARWRRRSALVKPLGSRREDAQDVQEGERTLVGQAQPGHAGAGRGGDRVGDLGQGVGSGDGVMAEYRAPSRRRLAVKPICRSAGRLVSRFPIPKSRVSLMVVSVLIALPSLWYCFIFEFL